MGLRSRHASWRTTVVFAIAALPLTCKLDEGGTDVGAPSSAAPSSSASPSSSSAGGGASGGAGGGSAGGGGAGGAVPACQGENEFVGGPAKHCYLQPPIPVTWDAAQAACRTWGGTLAGVSSEDEYNFILTQRADADFWIGARSATADGSTEGYAWENDEPWANEGWGRTAGMFPWRSGKPKVGEPCVKLHAGFESKVCDHRAPGGYLCERP